MDTNRPYAVPILLAVVVLVLPTTYVGGYFLRRKPIDGPSHAVIPEWRVRLVPTELEARLFSPLAKIEAVVTRLDVSTEPYDWLAPSSNP
jgi:hypothetical protein